MWKPYIFTFLLILFLLFSCKKEYQEESIVTESSPTDFTIDGDLLLKISDYKIEIYETNNPQLNRIAEIVSDYKITSTQTSHNNLIISTTVMTLVYDISNPYKPTNKTVTTPIPSCATIVTDTHRTYIINTNSTTKCNTLANQLMIYDNDSLTNKNPLLVYDFLNIKSISVTDSLLFVVTDKVQLFETLANDSIELRQEFYPLYIKNIIPNPKGFIGVTSERLEFYNYTNHYSSISSVIY